MSLLGKKTELAFKPKAFQHAIFFAVIALVGWLVVYNVQAGSIGKDKDADVDQMVKYFYMQGRDNVEVNENWPVWGNPDADVTIVEFSEYQCPYCRIAAFNFKPYLYDFKNDVRLYFVNYPLDNSCNEDMSRPMHPVACYAAKAAICAQGEGNFWKFHDELFRNQQKMSKSTIDGIAAAEGYDMQKFEACVSSPETEARIKEDLSAAKKLNITGTPTIFINGRKVRYWRDPEFLRKVLKKEISRASK